VGRRDYQRVLLRLNKGINQQADLAEPDQCADARNVWAPNGKVERRPGYLGVMSPLSLGDVITSNSEAGLAKGNEASPTGPTGNTLALSNLGINDDYPYWYLGYSSKWSSIAPIVVQANRSAVISGATQASPCVVTCTGHGFSTGDTVYIESVSGMSQLNSNTYAITKINADSFSLNGIDSTGYGSYSSGGLASLRSSGVATTSFKATYWNGSSWRWLRVNEWETQGVRAHHLSKPDGYQYFNLVPPSDWAAKTINSQSRYWIRFQVLGKDIDANCTVGLPAEERWVVSTSAWEAATRPRGAFAIQFPSEKRYVYVVGLGATSSDINKYQHILNSSDIYYFNNFGSTSNTNSVIGEPATVAIVPQFREAYVATNNWVQRIDGDVPSGFGDPQPDHVVKPTVEHRDFAVGEDAPYDPALIGQLGAWPECKYITFFKGRLWCAGIKDEPYVVRWTAAVPYHRVWPTLSAEPLMEDDRSPITGIAGFGEHLVVFKSDSIWMMVSVGENPATQVESYSPIKVVSGVGCVSQASIKQVRGNLIFLAEDGVYVFDGTPSVRKISDRIQDTIDSIVPARRPFSVAAHWKVKSCYLLSVSVDGSSFNNMVLVYDYKNDAWWLWDGLDAESWLEDESASDDEKIYFMNESGYLFELGADQADNRAAISSYVLTQRIGMGDNIRRTLRQVEVTGDNRCSSLTVSARVNDDEVNETSGSLSFTDSAEAQYGSATHAVDSFVQDRRRSRRIGFRKQGDYVQVKVAHSVKDETMEISSLDLGFAGGVRR